MPASSAGIGVLQDHRCSLEKASLTLAQYQAEEHIGIVSGTGQQLLEKAVKKFGTERRVVVRRTEV